MNENIVMAMINPYIRENELTYSEFDQIFKMLSLHEQYNVVEVINKKGIVLVDEHVQTLDNNNNCQFVGQGRTKPLFDLKRTVNESQNKPTDGYDNKNDSDGYLIVRDRITLSNKVLVQMIQEGNMQAKQDLCIKNQRLVDRYVNIYLRVFGNKLDFEDLEQVGMIGMLKAADKYDIKENTEFSTYAVWWIKQAISREIIDNGYTIRIPVHRMEQIRKVLRLAADYFEESDYSKRIEAISHASGLSIQLVEDCLQLADQFVRTTSLDLPVGEDEDTPLADMIPNDEEQNIEDLIIQSALKDQIKELINTLLPREQKVIRLRFGFEDGKERTLEEVGKELGVTRERIRQIESKALRKLQHPTRKNKLKEYMI